MMAKTDDDGENHPPGRKSAAPPALLVLLAVCFSVNDLLAAKALAGSSRAWQPLGALAANLLMVGAIWGFSRLRPSILKAALLSLLLGVVALAGFAVAAQVLVAARTLSGPWPWRTTFVLATNLLIGAGAIWGLLRLKPWTDIRASGEPVSPATRRANNLYWLKEGLAALAMAALIVGASRKDQPFGLLSNSPVPLWAAIVAITSWLLARGLREWWRSSADEHEQRASDVGRNAAAGVFFALTPAWWVAARAGLTPQPNAMVLWIIAMVVSASGWSWRRSH